MNILFDLFVSPCLIVMFISILWMLVDDHRKWKRRKHEADMLNKNLNLKGRDKISKYDLWYF